MMMMIEVPKSWQNAHHLVKDVLMPIVQNNLYYTCSNVYSVHYTRKVLDLPQRQNTIHLFNVCRMISGIYAIPNVFYKHKLGM